MHVVHGSPLSIAAVLFPPDLLPTREMRQCPDTSIKLSPGYERGRIIKSGSFSTFNLQCAHARSSAPAASLRGTYKKYSKLKLD